MKKLINILSIALVTLAFASCNQDYKIGAPKGFSVEGPAVVKVGEPVVFNLAGDVDILMFYSGENGHEYAKRDTDIIYPAKMSVKFHTVTSTVETPGMNPEKLLFKYSYDFSGEYTRAAVNEATWYDITNLFTWPTEQGQDIQAGEVYIDNLFPEDGRSIYLMFDYKVLKYDAETQPRGRVQWNVKDFFIYGGTDLGISELYNHMTMGWKEVDLENGDKNTSSIQWPTATNSRLNMRTQFKPDCDIELGVVSAAIPSPSGLNVGRHTGVSIKGVSDPQMKSYSYTFDEPGEYNVTFAGINANMNGTYEVPQTIKVKVINDEGGLVSPEQKNW